MVTAALPDLFGLKVLIRESGPCSLRVGQVLLSELQNTINASLRVRAR